MALGQDHVIVGKGSIQLLMPNSVIKTIKVICYMPRLKKNLLFVGQITNFRNLVVFTKSMYLVLMPRKLYKTIAIVRRDHQIGLYKLSSLVKKFEVYFIEAFVLPLDKSLLTLLARFEAHASISSLLIAHLFKSESTPNEQNLIKL